MAAWAHAANVAAVAHAVAKFAAAKSAAAKLFAAANLPAAKSQFDAANLPAAKFAAVVLFANVSSQKENTVAHVPLRKTGCLSSHQTTKPMNPQKRRAVPPSFPSP